jgi:hypothetical protein
MSKSEMDGDGKGTLASDVEVFVRRYVSLAPAQAIACVLWVIHTHVLEAAEFTPYLNITSAVPRSGKTRLLEVLRLLVCNPWFTSHTTAAALVRKIANERPTLLLDESDAAFQGDREYAEVLRGILNSGFERDGQWSHCARTPNDWTVRDFSTFCPKAIAGIGLLPETVRDRAIPIRLKRQRRLEKRERFRKRDIRNEVDQLRERLMQWGSDNREVLRNTFPPLPDELNDRQQDVSEPLVAIADLLGGDWPSNARGALIELLAGEPSRDASIVIQLLRDISTVFDEQGSRQLPTALLLSKLCSDESAPWIEWNHSKPLSASQLAKLLAPLEIYPRSIRINDATPKGYVRSDFEDAWERYTPCSRSARRSEPQQPQQTNVHAPLEIISEAPREECVAVPKDGQPPASSGNGIGARDTGRVQNSGGRFSDSRT